MLKFFKRTQKTCHRCLNPFFHHFPYLHSFMGSYFHQDCYDDGDTDATIIATWLTLSSIYDRMGLQADIDRFIQYHPKHLLREFETIIRPSVIIGTNDDEAKTWLMNVQTTLQSA